MNAAALALALALGAPEPPRGMVENPCPEPLVEPPAVVQFNQAFLAAGPPDLTYMIGLTRDPAYVAYEAEKKARAAADWGGLCIYRRANQDLRDRGTPVDVVFLGDSITENWARAPIRPSSPGAASEGASAARPAARCWPASGRTSSR